MKAEERKVLKSNALLTALKGFWSGLWEGTRSTSVYVGALVVALVVGVAVAWWVYSSVNADNRSKLWLKVDDLASLKDMPAEDKADPQKQVKFVKDNMEKLARENPGTMQARVARLEEARLLLLNGMERIALADPDAAENVRQAGKLYADLAKESADFPAAQQEALLGAAKANEGVGDLEAARKFYQQLADAKPESKVTELAKAGLKNLDDPEVQKFYGLLKQQLDKPKTANP